MKQMMKKLTALVLVLGMLLTGTVIAEETAAPETMIEAEVNAAETAMPEDEWAEPEETPVPGRLAGILIGINPGHQVHGDKTQDPVAPGAKKTRNRIGWGTSGVKTRAAEYAVNLQVSLKLKELLEAEGAQVAITRTENDVYVTNIERAEMLNEAGAALALQIHCNSSDNSKKQGISVYVRNWGDDQEASESAARTILSEMVAATGAKDAGFHSSDNYMSLNYSAVPAVLVEMGYMSNPEEDVLLSTDSYQDLLAQGMLEGICRWIAEQQETAGE